MEQHIKKISIRQNLKMKIGVKAKMIKGTRMNIKLGLLGMGLAIFISACNMPNKYGKADNTPYATKECKKQLRFGKEIVMSEKIDKIVVYKAKRRLEVYKNGVFLHSYRMSLGAKGGAKAGRKIQKGDYRTPEGSYAIVRKKCDRKLYKSLMISYPNKQDKARARKKGVNPGGYITIHGQPKWNSDGHSDKYTLSNDWTEGCMAVPNRAMDALWRAVENGVKIEIQA